MFIFFSLMRSQHISTLFPYTTLFRSDPDQAAAQASSRMGVKSRWQAEHSASHFTCTVATGPCACCFAPAGPRNRSEEHTSELQSHVNLVCRLLLEKKKRLL